MSRSAANCCAVPEDCCPEFESIRARRVLDHAQSRRLAVLFKVLANDTRLRLLHVLIRSGELPVTHLADELGMTPQAVSNQLQKLVALQVLESRREGNSIFYRVVDPCITSLLDRGLCLLEYTRSRSKRKALPV